MNTKDKIRDAALTLFAQKGYSGASVKDIAAAVGIKDSSLYKHYKSKQEIFDALVAEGESKISELTAILRIPENPNDSPAETGGRFGTISEEELQAISRAAFLFYLEDPFFMRLRRMLNREQYGNTEVYRIYRKIFMEDSVDYISALFKVLLEQNIFQGNNSRILAIHFYSPIFFLLAKYDGRPGEKEEALEILAEHIREFSRVYNVQRQTRKEI